jgi:hypothetical protein
MKKLFLYAWLGCIAAAIGWLFWHYEVQYSLPTPVPEDYRPVAVGEWIDLQGMIAVPDDPKPVFLHFYNPKCPCSKFNVPHFQELARDYGDKVHFGVVVMAKDNIYTEHEIQEKLELEVPVAFDKSIAAACGVYSTPQAVLLDADRRLYYRGNYNKSRYCTNKESNYAQQAIDSLLQDRYRPVFVEAALKSYGCQFPTPCDYTTP